MADSEEEGETVAAVADSGEEEEKVAAVAAVASSEVEEGEKAEEVAGSEPARAMHSAPRWAPA